MFKKLASLFGSKTKAQELIYLVHNIKKVVRQGFYESELPQIKKFCQENKLYCIKSKFKVLLTDESNYSNKGIRISEKDKRKGMYFVYISKDEEKSWLAAYYELMNNDQELGLVLGYPSCCVNFFCQEFNENNPNPQQFPSNPYTNITKREKDQVILSHFPCHSDCQESIILAKKKLDSLIKVCPDRARELVNSLR